jgi:hypothetical protein
VVTVAVTETRVESETRKSIRVEAAAVVAGAVKETAICNGKIDQWGRSDVAVVAGAVTETGTRGRKVHQGKRSCSCCSWSSDRQG